MSVDQRYKRSAIQEISDTRPVSKYTWGIAMHTTVEPVVSLLRSIAESLLRAGSQGDYKTGFMIEFDKGARLLLEQSDGQLELVRARLP